MILRRLLYGAVLVASIALFYYDENVITSHGLLCIFLLPIISFIHMLTTRLLFSFEESLDRERVIKNDKAHYIYKFQNRTILPFSPIRIIFSGDKEVFKEKSYVSNTVHLLPKDHYNLQIPLTCLYWGTYNVGIKQVIFYDFLGLFRMRIKNKKPYTLRVYPRIIGLKHARITPAFMENYKHVHQLSKGNREIISDIRQYRYGDVARDIHWKLSSKYDDLLIKQFDDIKSNHITFILDLYPLKTKRNLKKIQVHDKMVEVATAIMNQCLHLNYPIDFITQEGQMNFTVAEEFQYAYEHIASVKFAATESIIPLFNKLTFTPSTAGNMNVILVTHILNEELLTTLMNAHKINSMSYVFYISTKQLTMEDKEMYRTLLTNQNIHLFFIQLDDQISELSEGV